MIGVPGARPTIVPPLPGCTPLFDGAAMREADRHASERHGLPSILLMERAGLATAEAIRARWDGRGGVWVIAGPGNNGGDGLVVARHLAEAGWAVRVLAPAGRAPAGADAAVMVRVAASLGIVIEPLGDEYPPADAVVVDALLGTGASGLPRERWGRRSPGSGVIRGRWSPSTSRRGWRPTPGSSPVRPSVPR